MTHKHIITVMCCNSSKYKYMTQNLFFKNLTSNNQYSLCISEYEHEGSLFIIGMVLEIRYIVFFFKDFDEKKLNNSFFSLIKEIEFIPNLNIFYSGDKYNLVNNVKNLEHSKQKILDRNFRTLRELSLDFNCNICKLKELYNNKSIKTLKKKSPNFWFNKIKNYYSFKTNDKHFCVKLSSLEPTEIISPNKSVYKDLNLISLKLFDDNLSKLTEDYIKNTLKYEYNSNPIKMILSLKEIFLSFINTQKENLSVTKKNYILMEESLRKNEETKDLIKAEFQSLKNKYNKISKNYKELEKHNSNLNFELKKVSQEIEIQKNIRECKEKLILKKKNAKTYPKRDKIDYDELIYILSLVNKNSFYEKRKLCAFVLLYITGLRVSNLLIFKVEHIKLLINNGSMRIDLIKRGNCDHLITLSKGSHEFLKSYADYFFQLVQHKEDGDYFFTSLENFSKPLNRCIFNKDLNSILKKCSIYFDKNIRTHSFRTSFITDLLSEVPLHIAKEIVGHKVISSTEIYYRSHLNKKECFKILNSVDQTRFNNKKNKE